MAWLLYGVLLLVWIPLLWPAVRMRGWGRGWIRGVTAVGLLASLYEAWMTLVWTPRVVAPIRLDIPLLSLLLLGLYATAAFVLARAGWRRGASLLALLLLGIGGAMGYVWAVTARESRRLARVLTTRDALLFEAKFRSRSVYEAYFGLAAARAPASHPVGHWAADDPAHYSRLVINPAGQAWLFHRCGQTECQLGPEGSGIRPAGDSPETWEATLEKRGVGRRALVITREAPDRLSVRVDGRPVRFLRAEPPIPSAPPAAALRFLGPFSRVELIRQHARVTQVWVWQDDARLYAVGIFATLIAGARADFVRPVVMGEGIREGGAWRFRFPREGRAWQASLAPEGSGVALRLERDGEALAPALLARGAIFDDEVIALAPLTGPDDWRRWFEVVLTGHFTSGVVPAS